MSKINLQSFFLLLFCVSVFIGCAVSSAESETKSATSATVTKKAPVGATIEIAPDSPADTVRSFYKHLREQKIRDAMFLTNLRPAVEGLTDAELKEFQLDFANLAKIIPEEIEINGEIVSGDAATVTANLPDNDTEQMKVQTLNLRRDGKYWTLLVIDEAAEAEVRKQGGNYFHRLRIVTHQTEVEKLLESLGTAQVVHAASNDGNYGDLQTFADQNIVPSEMLAAPVYGYRFVFKLSADKKDFTVEAVPEVYGKTGNLTFLLESRRDKKPLLRSGDSKGKSLQN